MLRTALPLAHAPGRAALHRLRSAVADVRPLECATAVLMARNPPLLLLCYSAAAAVTVARSRFHWRPRGAAR